MSTTAKQQKTPWLTAEEGHAQRAWFVVDLDGKILGRACSKIAMVLRGKHKPTFTPNVDMGDFVVVINAGKVQLTGKKWTDKPYRYHTGFPGGLVEMSAEKLAATHPERMIRRAVWGMLPKGPLGRRMIKKLKIYRGAEHQHAAQQPQPLAL